MEDILVGIIKCFGATIHDIVNSAKPIKGVLIVAICFLILYILLH